MSTVGYDLPDVIPTDLQCIQVYVPNCPEAVLALKGSFDFLCRWVAWRRTGDTRALEMAQAFKRADVLSWESCDMGTIIDCDDIRDIIREELANMNIIVKNCGCGCGCGGGGQSGQSQVSEDDLPPGANPAEPTAGNPEDNAWLCRAAHDVCNRYIQFWQQVQTYSTNITTDVLAAILDGLLIFYNIGGVFASLLTVIGQYLASGLATAEIAMFTALCPAIISAIRTAPDAATAKANVLNIIWSASYPYHVRLAGYYLASSGNWDMVFTPGSWDAPANEDCEDVVEPGVCWMPEGYEGQRAATLTTETASEYTVSANLVANAGADDCGQYSEFALVGLLTDQNQTWRHVLRAVYPPETPEAVGYCLEVYQNEAVGGNSPDIPVTRLEMDDDHDNFLELSHTAYAPYIVVVCKAVAAPDFEPLVGTVISELYTVADDEWDWETQPVYFGSYRRSGVSNNVFGGASLGGRFRYIRPSS